MAPLLSLSGVTLAFGGVTALKDVEFCAEGGECVALVGPNGSGKSTIVNVAAGLYRPQAGVVRLDGRDVTPLPMRARVRMGIARTHQTPRFFERLTVAENLRTALDAHGRWTQALLASPRSRRERDERIARHLEIFGLGGRGAGAMGTLTLPERRRLEIARATIAGPRLLLLDEPAAGLSAGEAEALTALLRDTVLAPGRAVVLVEHRTPVLDALATRFVEMRAGAPVATPSARRRSAC